jgi:2',3'-cyclic-nucleotide 2'-phosphodiesterase (5'-nucleotidase family)
MGQMKRYLLSIVSVLLIQIALFSPSLAQDKKLTILYTNDLHAQVDPAIVPFISKTRPIGGFANVATLVKRQKAADRNTVYFDAGDYFTGPYISSLTKGEAVVDAMNYLGLDATTIGNHEFDHGWENVLLQLAKAKFPIVNGNLFLKGTDKLMWNRPYLIKKVNGIRIGVIGLHGKFIFIDTVPADAVKGVEARAEEVYLRKYIQELRNKVDLIVVLAHEGVPPPPESSGLSRIERNLKRDIDLAKEVPGIDIIVSGHAHQGTPEPLVSNGTLIVSTDASTRELGKLEITYNKKRDKITSYKNTLDVLYDDEVPDDEQMTAVIKKWKQRFVTITEEVVTNTSVALRRSPFEECLLGDMVADSMLSGHPDSDLAVTNSFGLRQDIDAGPVTVGELITAFPFANTVVKLEMKGSDLRDLFETSASLASGVLQVSKGVEMVFDESRPVGQRVVKCEINGAPIDDNKIYKVITSNYLADGGDGFPAFARALSYEKTGVEMMQAMIKYLKQFKTYEPKLEGRVKKTSK